DRNRSHWSTSKTPSYTKSVSWQHHLEPSDVEYYFEPVTIQESGTSILKNELENSEDGAGQVGFQLSNDGTNEIQYGKSNYYSFQHPHEGSNQIPLFIRPRTYGNNVSSGQIMSRVKIVVVYN
ncbi:hypothetical protein ABN284_23715, partial [Escherichia coli]|nr:hypothetical protein [Escherichia coli]MDZ7130745.1 hypothetical protein [Escherichia coli]